MSSKQQILDAAVRLAESLGYNKITRDAVADEAGVACGLVNYHFKNMVDLREAIIEHAVANKLYNVIAQGIVSGHPVALAASDTLKKKALNSLL